MDKNKKRWNKNPVKMVKSYADEITTCKCYKEFNPGQMMLVTKVDPPICAKCHHRIDTGVMTATMAQASMELSENNKLVMGTLKQIQSLLTQLNDCISLLTHPMYERKD